MTHHDIAWYCGECGYPRHHETPHTCPPDAQAVLHKLVDALPTNAPDDQIREEIESLSALLKEHRPDALQVNADALRWFLAAFSFLDVSSDALKAHTAILRGKVAEVMEDEKESREMWLLSLASGRLRGLFLSDSADNEKVRLEVCELYRKGLVNLRSEGDGGIRVNPTEKGLALLRKTEKP